MNSINKTVLITGASRGIGKACALAFACEGYQIIINSCHNESLLNETKNEIEQLGVSCLALCGNIGDPDFVHSLFSQAKNRFGSIDILINNAGMSIVGLLTELTNEQWQEILSTNLSSVIYTSREVIPLMLANGSGKIINVSSVWGCIGASCEAAYSATKGGMNAFTMALAKELAPMNIQVNAIACGVVDTQMNQFMDKEEAAELAEEIPTGRFASSEEVADFIISLTQKNSYLTGQVIRFDGGWY